jgi:formylglycine-generating enzyme required for sulfatase activity
MPDQKNCPTCGYSLQLGQGECPNCGQVISQDKGDLIPPETPPVPTFLFQQLLDDAHRYEQADDLNAALDAYRRALAIAQENQGSDHSLKLTAQTLRPLIKRLEQLAAQRAKVLPVAVVENTDDIEKKAKLRRSLVGIGIAIPVCILLSCLAFYLQRTYADRAHAQATSNAVAQKTLHVVQTLTAAPTLTPTITQTSSKTPTITSSPTPTVPTSTPSLTPSITPIPIFGSIQVSPIDNMVLHFIPGGYFWMGSGTTMTGNYGPVHQVSLDPYWIDETEVTNFMYDLCVKANACQPPSSLNVTGRNNYYGDPKYNDFPVANVTWIDAVDYCTWAGRSLPTEAQWEKAARGEKDQRVYPWGNEFNQNWVNSGQVLHGTSYGTTKVGSFPDGKSRYGALDMSGNVSEWVLDWFDPHYYNYSPSLNPTGPDSPTASHVMRGGSWYANSQNLVRVTYRTNAGEDFYIETLGFRCVLPTSP